MHQLHLLSVSLLLSSLPLVANAQPYGPPPPPTPPEIEEEEEEEVEEVEPDSLQFSVEGQVRLREEMHRHLFSPGDPSGVTKFDLTHLRSRAALLMKKGDVSAVVEMQDIRWLGEAGTVADSEGLDLRRGALRVDGIGDTGTWLEAGRMVLAYGDQRLVGHLEWVNQARTFDGARLRLVLDQFFIDAWFDAFVTVTRETRDAHDDQYFGGVYTSVAPGAEGWRSEIYALGLVDRLEAPGEGGTGKSAFATLGTRQAYKQSGIDAALEVVLQAGKLASDDFLAYAMAARFAYTVEESAVKPRFGCEFVYGSGDSDFSDGDQGTFQNLFPTNHLHYGYADQAGWSNLTALRASAGIAPVKAWRADVDYHHLRLSDPAGGWFHAGGALLRNGSPDASSHLGDEIDLKAKYWWRKGLIVEAGYALFLPGGFVEDTGGSFDTAHFAYLQMIAKMK
jgi:hypothetical protein